MTPTRAYWLSVLVLLIGAGIFVWSERQDADPDSTQPSPPPAIDPVSKDLAPFPIESLSPEGRRYLNSAQDGVLGLLIRPDPIHALKAGDLKSLASYYTSLNGENDPGLPFAQKQLFKHWGTKAPREATRFCLDFYQNWHGHPSRRASATKILSSAFEGWAQLDATAALASWESDYAALPLGKVVPGESLQVHDHVVHGIISSWSRTDPKAAWKHLQTNLDTISAHALNGFFRDMHPESPWTEIAEVFKLPAGRRIRHNADLFAKEWTAYHADHPLIWLIQRQLETTSAILKKYYRPNDEIIDEVWLGDHWSSLGEQTRVHTLQLVLQAEETQQ